MLLITLRINVALIGKVNSIPTCISATNKEEVWRVAYATEYKVLQYCWL